jgi:hypothetical protein
MDVPLSFTEVLEIARDVARKLMEARSERSKKQAFTKVSKSFDYQLIVSA